MSGNECTVSKWEFIFDQARSKASSITEKCSSVFFHWYEICRCDIQREIAINYSKTLCTGGIQCICGSMAAVNGWAWPTYVAKVLIFHWATAGHISEPSSSPQPHVIPNVYSFMPSLNTLLLVIVFELISSSHPRTSHHMHLHFILNHSSPNHLQLAHSPLGPLAKPCCLVVEISITICTFIHPRTNTSKLVQGKKKKKKDLYPFQDVLLVLSVVHEECHLPAGIAVERVELLASWVVWKVAVTGVQRLACVHRVQDHFVSYDNLKGQYNAHLIIHC